MGLDKIALEVLARELSKEYLKKITYLSSISLMDYELNLNEELENFCSIEEKYKILSTALAQVKDELNSINAPDNIDEWQNGITDLMIGYLKGLDLNSMEYPSNTNSLWFLNVINKGYSYIEDAKLVFNNLESSNIHDWTKIINQIQKKSKSNSIFWKEFKSRFHFDALDRSDESNILLIYDLGSSFYSNLSTKLFFVLESHTTNGEVEKEVVIEAFSTVISSFIRKENDLIFNLNRIKDRYDDEVEDVNNKVLLNKIIRANSDLTTSKTFELIKNLEKIKFRISTFQKNRNSKSIVVTKKKHTSSKKKGVEWIGNDDQLAILFDELIETKIMEPINNGNKKEFFDFFKGGLMKRNSFRWKKNINLIAYLFEELKTSNLIDAWNCNYNSVIRNYGFFVSNKNNPILSLKHNKNQYLNNEIGKPINYTSIDTIISKLIK